MRLTARDYDSIAEEQEALIQQEIKEMEFIMMVKDLNDSHIGGIFKILDSMVVLQDVIHGEKQTLLHTNLGNITLEPDTQIVMVA